MAERFSMDAAGARAVGRDVQGDGQTLHAAFRTLSGVNDRLFGCWGDDEFGKAFSEAMVPKIKEGLENFGTLATNHESLGEGIVDIVTEFENVDEENAERLDNLQAENVETWDD